MLRLIFILISVILLSSHISTDGMIKVRSNRLVLNQGQDKITYEGNVKIEFEEYDLITSKVIIYLEDEAVTSSSNGADKKAGQKSVKNAVFPGKIRAITKDNSEVLMANKGEYDGKSFVLKLEGDVLVERLDSFYKMNILEVRLGKLAKIGEQRL